MLSSKLIQRGAILFVILALFSTFGCTQYNPSSPFSHPVDEFFGNPPSVPPGLFDPVEGETGETYEELYEDADYKVVESRGTYNRSSGIANFSWKLHTQEGDPPSLQKFACVEPVELPERFWEDYDSGEPLIDRENVDKKWRNLYIPLDEYGILQFSMKTRIPGSYSFELCGILDDNYTNEESYSGEGSITIEVPDQGLIVVESECVDGLVYETFKYAQCQWKMEFANGSKFNCWEKRPFSNMNSTNGQTKKGIFEILVDRGNAKEYHILTASRRFCGMHMCGCGFGPYITVTVHEGETVRLSIVKVNEEYYSYTGDGDVIIATFSK